MSWLIIFDIGLLQFFVLTADGRKIPVDLDTVKRTKETGDVSCL